MSRNCALLIVVIGLAVSTAAADSGWGVFGSYWSPADAEESYGAGLKLKRLLSAATYLEIRGSYFPAVESRPEGWELETIPIEVGLLMASELNKNAAMTLGGGIGYYVMQEVEFDDTRIRYDDEYGYYAVLGVEIALSPQLDLIIEGKYTWLEIEKVRINGEKAEARHNMEGGGANVGFLFRW